MDMLQDLPASTFLHIEPLWVPQILWHWSLYLYSGLDEWGQISVSKAELLPGDTCSNVAVSQNVVFLFCIQNVHSELAMNKITSPAISLDILVTGRYI